MRTFWEHPANIAVETLKEFLRGCIAHFTDPDVGNMLKQVVENELNSTERKEENKKGEAFSLYDLQLIKQEPRITWQKVKIK